MQLMIKKEIKDINIDGDIFKYKPVTAGDELDWIPEYMDEVEVIDKNTGKKRIIMKQNLGRLSIQKFRNIIEVPFSKEEIKEYCGLDKDFKDFTGLEKVKLFRNLSSEAYDKIISSIDKINSHLKND
jgi:hypothetical protein